MTEKELVREIKILVLGKNPLSETWEDINGKIIALLKANLKDIVEIDQEKLGELLRKWICPIEGLVESIAEASPVRWKKEK